HVRGSAARFARPDRITSLAAVARLAPLQSGSARPPWFFDWRSTVERAPALDDEFAQRAQMSSGRSNESDAGRAYDPPLALPQLIEAYFSRCPDHVVVAGDLEFDLKDAPRLGTRAAERTLQAQPLFGQIGDQREPFGVGSDLAAQTL